MSENTNSHNDDQLVAKLRQGLNSADPVPEDVTRFASAVYEWRTIDAELAELDFDSVDEDVPSGVRSTATVRMVSFQAGKWLIDIEHDPATGRLMGQVTPESRFSVELHTSGAHFSVESDDKGGFEAESVDGGPLSLVLRFEDGTVVKTAWIIL